MDAKILEYKKELEKLKNNLLNEEEKNRNLNDLLLKKDNQIKTLNQNYEDLLNKQNNLNDELIQKKNEIEKYIINNNILKEQNDKLMDEINKIISFNQKFRNILNRKEKIKNLMEDNKTILQDSLKTINLSIDEDANQNTF